MNDQWKIEAPARLVAATLLALVVAPAAFAADNTADSATVSEVVVTGSRIARPELESTTPITIVSAPEIEASGYLNAADVLHLRNFELQLELLDLRRRYQLHQPA
jgi:hypothetical protein